MMSLDDHKRMQETLWAWENCQLGANRETITRLLAERLQYAQPARLSLEDCELTYMAILAHFSM